MKLEQHFLIIQGGGVFDVRPAADLKKKKTRTEVVNSKIHIRFVLKVTGISEEQLLVTVLPGFPTTAELFIVPERRAKHGSAEERRARVDQVGCCRSRGDNDREGFSVN